MLAGKPGVFRERQFGRAGAAKGNTLTRKRNGFHLAVGTLNQEFAVHELSLGTASNPNIISLPSGGYRYAVGERSLFHTLRNAPSVMGRPRAKRNSAREQLR